MAIFNSYVSLPEGRIVESPRWPSQAKEILFLREILNTCLGAGSASGAVVRWFHDGSDKSTG